MTKLVVNLDGVDPDDAFSTVPYMKGHTFLYYLEELLGSPQDFEAFLRDYFETFKFKSIVTSDWKNHLYKYFSNKTQVSLKCNKIKTQFNDLYFNFIYNNAMINV